MNNRLWKKLKAQASPYLGDSFWNDIAGLLPSQGPRIDHYCRNGEATIVVELPGLTDLRKIRLAIEGDELRISGTIPWDYPVDEEALLLAERFFGRFERKIALPGKAVGSRAKAAYANGLLTIRIPLDASEPEPVAIEIENVAEGRKEEKTNDPT